MERAGRLRAWLSSPAALRRVSGWLTLGWVAMIPVSFFLHWLSSVTYVAALSLWALVSGHWAAWQGAAWQGARTEVRQERAEGESPDEDSGRDSG